MKSGSVIEAHSNRLPRRSKSFGHRDIRERLLNRCSGLQNQQVAWTSRRSVPDPVGPIENSYPIVTSSSDELQRRRAASSLLTYLSQQALCHFDLSTTQLSGIFTILILRNLTNNFPPKSHSTWPRKRQPHALITTNRDQTGRSTSACFIRVRQSLHAPWSTIVPRTGSLPPPHKPEQTAMQDEDRAPCPRR